MITRYLHQILLLLFLLLGTSVSNAATRIEQDDRNISYSGSWYSNSVPFHSSGTATLTNTRGARATLSFIGTGINWIGVRDAWSGLATVSLDGSITIIDTYSQIAHYQD